MIREAKKAFARVPKCSSHCSSSAFAYQNQLSEHENVKRKFFFD